MYYEFNDDYSGLVPSDLTDAKQVIGKAVDVQSIPMRGGVAFSSMWTFPKTAIESCVFKHRGISTRHTDTKKVAWKVAKASTYAVAVIRG